MHPVIEEINRARGIEDVRPDVFRRWQQQLRAEIQPRLDTLDAIEAMQDTTQKPPRVRG